MSDCKNKRLEETLLNTLAFLSNDDLVNLLEYAHKLKNEELLGYLFEERNFEQPKKQAARCKVINFTELAKSKFL